MIKCKTFQAWIYCGLRVGYTEECFTYEDASCIIQKYINDIGWCVTIRKVDYIYKDGAELGVAVGVINYPRFPLSEDEIKRRTIELAQKMKDGLCQNRVSIVFPNETVMLGEK